MGINNLVRFFRHSIETPRCLPQHYNLAIDVTLLLIPMLKISRTTDEFIACFERYFDEQHELRRVIANAAEVFVGLDFLYPAMKRDTCQKRQREYRRQQERQASSGKSIQRYRSIAASAFLSTPPSPPQHQQTYHTVLAWSLHLKHVRDLVEPLFVRSLTRWCANSSHMPHTRFDVLDYGEGEVKCFKYRDWTNKRLPTVVLSNDNDVLLMMLMHGAMNGSSTRTKYFRVATVTDNSGGSGFDDHERCVLQQISLRKLLQLINGTGAGVSTQNLRIYEHNAWILVVWLIATYGSDYVQAIRCSGETTTRRWIVVAIRCFLAFRAPVPLNRHTFCSMLMLLFDVVTTTGNADQSASSVREILSRQRLDHMAIERCTRIDESDRTLCMVYRWCLRVYWNILYLLELPIDFTRRFATETNMSVNTYVTKQTLTETMIRGLTMEQHQQLHHMFCMFPDELSRYNRVSS